MEYRFHPLTTIQDTGNLKGLSHTHPASAFLPKELFLKLFDLSGRIALITGSSKGIGFALAAALGAAGARVVLNARDAASLTAARDALRTQGVAAEAVSFDVTDAAAVEAGVARIEAEIGPIEIRDTIWASMNVGAAS